MREKLHLNPQKKSISNYFHLPNPCLTQFSKPQKKNKKKTGINASTTETASKKKTFLCVSWEHTKKKFGQINQFPGQFEIRHKKKEKYENIIKFIVMRWKIRSCLTISLFLSLSLSYSPEKLILKSILSYCWCCCWWNLLFYMYECVEQACYLSICVYTHNWGRKFDFCSSSMKQKKKNAEAVILGGEKKKKSRNVVWKIEREKFSEREEKFSCWWTKSSVVLRYRLKAHSCTL